MEHSEAGLLKWKIALIITSISDILNWIDGNYGVLVRGILEFQAAYILLFQYVFIPMKHLA
jgi:hypothetical protein